MNNEPLLPDVSRFPFRAYISAKPTNLDASPVVLPTSEGWSIWQLLRTIKHPSKYVACAASCVQPCTSASSDVST